MVETNRAPGWLTIPLLLLILTIAAGLRFYNINWDHGIFAHPDERSTVAFYAPTIKWPDDSTPILDPRASPLNPFWNVDSQERRSFTYGHFPLYTLVLTANFLNDLVPFIISLPIELPPEWTQFLATSLTGHGFARIGRFLVALSDLATVYLIFLLGRRLYTVWGGLLAAAFAAFTVLQIQLAHFFAVDPVSTTFTLLALYGAILFYDRQTVGTAVLTGVGIALAVASKFSALPIIFAPIVAGYFVIRHHKLTPLESTDGSEARSRDRGPSKAAGLRIENRVIALTLLALAVSFTIFALTSPFVLLDFENFKRAVLDEQGNMVSGVADFPFTRQYRTTTAYWYFVVQQLRWGMGWSLGLLALAGTFWVMIRTVRGKAQVGELLALLWIIFYFGPTGLFLAKFMRYMVPVVPLFSLFGAGLIVGLWQYRTGKQQPVDGPPPTSEGTTGERAAREPGSSSIQLPSPVSNRLSSRFGFTRSVAIILASVTLLGSAFWALAFVNGVYGSEHTWVTFARWTYANVPDGSCIAYEHWDDRMPTDIPEPGGHPGAHQYRQPVLPMYDNDSQLKYELIRDTLMNCDYVALASNRLSRTIPGLPERYPMSSRYYEALFSGELGFELLYSVETPPRLGPFVFDDQPADESFTVYDHPKPILFKKTRQLSVAEWDKILGDSWEAAIPGYVGPATFLMRLRGATGNFASSQPSQSPEAEKSLLLGTRVDRLPVVDDYRWNDVANHSPFVAIVLWWFLMMAVGLITFPLTYLLFHKLPDRGYGLSKSLGLLLVGYFVWLSGSLVGGSWLGNTVVMVILVLALLAVIGLAVVLIHSRPLIRSFIWHQQWWLILTTESIFGLIYLVFVYLRILNPDLWHPWLGGEKMLEIGFLNAIVKSVEMPPYDPFFAGGIINYYYYGLFLVGVLIKLSGIQPSIAFNLAVPTLAALTAVNAFSLASNLASSILTARYKLQPARLNVIATGLLAVLFIVFLGNLEGAAQFLRNLADLSLSDFDSTIPGLATLLPAISGLLQVMNGNSLAAYNYWDPTRVIPETINEFPFFSFLFADLHPHMIGIPFTILFLSLAFNWLLPDNTLLDESGGASPVFLEEYPLRPFKVSSIVRWLAIPFVLGAIAVINTWDLPTYLGLIVAAFLLGLYRQHRARLSFGRAAVLIVRGAIFAGGLVAVTYLLYGPFFINYQPPAETGVGFVRTRTPVDQHLKIWGLFLFIILSWLWLSLLYPASRNSLLRVVSLFLRRWNVWPHLSEIYRAVIKRGAEADQLGLWGVGLLVVVSLALLLLGYRVPFYLLPMVGVALILLFRKEVSAATAYLGLLIFTRLSILLGVEFIFLRDFLGGGDYYRMNTLFKFYIQVWVIFGVVAAVTLPQIWGLAWRWSWPGQIIWQGTVLILLIASLVYPVLGTRTRVDDRFPGDQHRPAIGTLDGLAYMSVGIFEWPAGNPIELRYDYEAIRWLQENVQGTPILAEARVGYYREGGMRVAAYTGLPSILGGLHQNEQRYGSQISSRDFVVNEFWNTPDPIRTFELIEELNISYIYIGQVEQATYGDHIGDKFEQLYHQGRLELVFENDRTRIYRRAV